jgi:hypothetical protein
MLYEQKIGAGLNAGLFFGLIYLSIIFGNSFFNQYSPLSRHNRM